MDGPLVHISDLHLGPPASPRAVEALVDAVQALRPAAVVCTGDLVQWGDSGRAWDEAETLLARLPSPRLLVPGNHDQCLWNVGARFLRPFRRYRQLAERVGQVAPGPSALTSAPLRIAGACIAGLASARSVSLDLGWVSSSQLRRLATELRPRPRDELRVVALHHGLRELPFTPARTRVHLARRLEQTLHRLRVDVVLTGHNHFPHAQVLRGPRGSALLWAQAGTACSTRFRHSGFRRHSFSSLSVSGGECELTWWGAAPGAEAFRPFRTLRFDRRRRTLREPRRPATSTRP